MAAPSAQADGGKNTTGCQLAFRARATDTAASIRLETQCDGRDVAVHPGGPRLGWRHRCASWQRHLSRSGRNARRRRRRWPRDSRRLCRCGSRTATAPPPERGARTRHGPRPRAGALSSQSDVRDSAPSGPGGTLNPLERLAFVGNSLPRRCGIATFTTDLQQAIEQLRPHEPSCIVAMTDPDHTYDYPPAVRLQINDRDLEDYEHAAHALNMAQCEVVSLQHEFGIFGGEAGAHILALTSRLTMPLVTTLHTVLSQPTPAQRRVLAEILDTSSRVIVMADKGRELLRSVYRVPAKKIEVIPHGTPDCAFAEPDEAKAALGFAGRPVILTFGLLSPSKGIEVMIDAMPEILKTSAAAVYVVLGATHPNLIRDQGEAYRDGLMRRVRELGVEEHVVFLDRFVDQATLLRFISMCDVYATPYLNEAQMTSGTLAYSFGLGKAIVSTPYWHARELLGEGRGILVPFGDAMALGRETAALLSDEPRRLAMRERAHAAGRSMIWPRIAERYRAVFASLGRSDRRHLAARQDAARAPRNHQPSRAMPIGH